ncbi:MAG: glycosyltransferase [Planctomycetota bacterium]
MKVLHATHLFPPESRGGTQSYVAALAAHQRERGWAVTVLSGTPDHSRAGTTSCDVHHGLEVRRLHRDLATEGFSADVGAPALEGRVAAELDALGPDLIHVHHWNGLVWNLVALAKERGIRVVVTLHDLYTTCGRFFRMPDARRFCADDVTFEDCARCVSAEVGGMDPAALATVLAERFRRYQDELARADAVLCVSEAQRRLLEGLPGFGDHGLRALPIGIPGGFGGRETPGPAPATLPLRLVNWGGLDPRKGVHVLLEALRLVPEPTRFRVDLHGGGLGGAYHRELEALAAGRDVHFHGRYADEALLRFGREYDLAVFPFLAFETYGLVVDEALRLGMPVLTADHGAPPERLGGRGASFPRGDAAALAERLDALAAEPSRLDAMRAAPHRAGDFEAHADAIEALYRAL